MDTVSLQLLLKGDLSKFLEKLLSKIHLARARFLDRVTKRKRYGCLLKSDSTTDALPAILKLHRTNKRNTYGGVSFRYSYR